MSHPTGGLEINEEFNDGSYYWTADMKSSKAMILAVMKAILAIA